MHQEKDLVLVLSGGGSKGIYTCGIFKGIEELGLKKRIKAIYGVSAGALCGAYRASGRKAENIFERFIKSKPFSIKNIALPPKMGLIKRSAIEEILNLDIKKDFQELEIPLFVGATNLFNAKFILFSEGETIKPLLGSIAVPGIFSPVEYKNRLLVDGGVSNNFPITIAKKQNPDEQIIGVLLNQFKKNQKIKNIFDSMIVSYDALLNGKITNNLHYVDHLFKRNLSIGMMESNEKKLKEIFDLGYQDTLEKCKTL